MKSEKAKSFIDNDAIQMNNGDRMIDASTAYTAVELAEQEAEERMRQKAIKAFECILYMSTKQLAEECGVSIDRVCEDAGIDYCRQLFIKKLNENENDD